jgi:hypothetical protein
MNFWVKKTAIIFTLLMGILVLWYPVAAGTADTPDLTGISVSGLDKGLSGTSATFGSTLENARTASAGNSFAISPDSHRCDTRGLRYRIFSRWIVTATR